MHQITIHQKQLTSYKNAIKLKAFWKGVLLSISVKEAKFIAKKLTLNAQKTFKTVQATAFFIKKMISFEPV